MLISCGGSRCAVGDLCVLASALFYACTTVRLGLYANKFQAVKFAASKMLMLCIISMGWLALEVMEGEPPNSCSLGADSQLHPPRPPQSGQS